jgi:DNA-binding HxlR family transcriptional regulator
MTTKVPVGDPAQAAGAGATDPGVADVGATETGRCDAGLVRAFDFLGKRWNGVILGVLSLGPVGFADLRRGVGAITDSVLSDRLAELTAGGLILRSVSDSRPPAVTYALSPAGTALLPILEQLARWASGHLPDRC